MNKKAIHVFTFLVLGRRAFPPSTPFPVHGTAESRGITSFRVMGDPGLLWAASAGDRSGCAGELASIAESLSHQTGRWNSAAISGRLPCVSRDHPKTAFRNSESRLRIYLGISELRRGTSNTGDGTEVPPRRYVNHREEFEDENASGNPQEIELRRANPRILIGDEAARGFDALPIMQLRLGATAEAPPQIDPDYIPPVLCQEAWPQVSSFVRSVYDRLSALADQLARQMADRGVSFTSGHREDFERILHLHALNTALGGFAPLRLLAECIPM